jgi:hypothetical protein
MGDIASALFGLVPGLRDSAKISPSHIMIQCPFHGDGKEKNPSCSVATDKPVFFCHACQSTGHISRLFSHFGLGKEGIAQVLKSTGMDRSTAPVKGRGKVAVRFTTGSDPFRGKYILDEDLLDEYRQAPVKLLRAGFEKRTLRHFEVGYDQNNMRITFPIRNKYGDLVGISGRAVLDYQEPRYKIYDGEMKLRAGFSIPPEYTMEAIKDAVLWHAHVVRPFFFTNEPDVYPLIVTEGFKACMWCWQSGYESTVALVGAYLSDLHAELIGTAVRIVVLFLDNNKAGYRGTLRAGRLLTAYGIDVRVALYPDEREQPDELTPDEVDQAIQSSCSYLQWRQQDHVRQLIDENASTAYRSKARGPEAS